MHGRLAAEIEACLADRINDLLLAGLDSSDFIILRHIFEQDCLVHLHISVFLAKLDASR